MASEKEYANLHLTGSNVTRSLEEVTAKPMNLTALHRVVKRAGFVLGLLGCSCLLTSCSTCGSFLGYLLRLPFNVLNAFLTY